MMHRPTREGSSAADEAAYWFARMRAPGATRERDRFERWLAGDPARAIAYRACESMWDGVRDAAADEEILAMRREALALGPRPRRVRWEHFAALAATLVLFLVGGIVLLRDNRIAAPGDAAAIAQLREPNVYRTAVGQRSSLMLTDGSVVELNTASVIQVDFTEGRREVRLLRGQALFDVAHDSRRPFVVEAAGKRVTALGTRFDVRLESNEMRVTLIEGSVSVERADGSAAAQADPAPVRLRPGEQLIALADQPFVVQAANVEHAVSWQSGRVVFSDEPLAEVIEEINRYSERKVVLGDSSLAGLRVSGVFRTGSVDGFVSALDAAFPVEGRLDSSSNTIVLGWD